METAQLVTAIIGASGGGAVIIALINGLFKWLSGAASRERARNTSLETQRVDAIKDRDEANDRADREAAKKRAEQEYSAALRRQLITNGITPLEPPITRTVKKEK